MAEQISALSTLAEQLTWYQELSRPVFLQWLVLVGVCTHLGEHPCFPQCISLTMPAPECRRTNWHVMCLHFAGMLPALALL